MAPRFQHNSCVEICALSMKFLKINFCVNIKVNRYQFQIFTKNKFSILGHILHVLKKIQKKWKLKADDFMMLVFEGKRVQQKSAFLKKYLRINNWFLRAVYLKFLMFVFNFSPHVLYWVQNFTYQKSIKFFDQKQTLPISKHIWLYMFLIEKHIKTNTVLEVKHTFIFNF